LTGRAYLVLLLLGVVAAPAAGESGVPLPLVPRGEGESCVEPVQVMRREHMDLLYAHRDETVRRGDRDPKHSLAGCVDCHSQTDATGARVPVDAPGQFCASCHAYASVAVDCFQCHATVPAGARVAAGAGAGAPLLDRLARALFGGGSGERKP
jgi:hypothetical protein